MKKLIQGIVEFRKNFNRRQKALFSKLDRQQRPAALFIGCSDSRVDPHFFARANPGDIFILRNVGNLIPPPSSKESSVLAAIEFATLSLHVSHIIVCGHSQCGAMEALSQGIETLSAPHLKSWLKLGEPSLKKMREGSIRNPSLSEPNLLSQVNVLQQIENLTRYPFIGELLAKKELYIHGWWFSISETAVYCYEEQLHQFVLIDEKEANSLLKKWD